MEGKKEKFMSELEKDFFKTIINMSLIKLAGEGTMATFCVYLHYALKESIEKKIDTKSFDVFLKNFSFNSINFNDILEKFDNDEEFISFGSKILQNLPIVEKGEISLVIDEEKMQMKIQKLFEYFESQGVLNPCLFIASNAEWFLKLQYYYPIKSIQRDEYIRKHKIYREMPSYPEDNKNSILNGLTEQEVIQMVYNINESSKINYSIEVLLKNGIIENKGTIELTHPEIEYILMEKIDISTTDKIIHFDSEEQMNYVLKEIMQKRDLKIK